MMMRYEMDTPKHLRKMAASNTRPSEGNEMADRDANDAARCGACAALRVSRYRPRPAVRPHQMTVRIPGMSPPEAKAWGLGRGKGSKAEG